MKIKTEENIIESEAPLDYFEFPVSDKDDIVANIFHVNLEEQILELSNEFCKYYRASNVENESEYFAIVYEEGFLPPIKIIDHLKKNPVAGLNRIWDFAIVNISTINAQKLVVIVDSYDLSSTLAGTVKNKGILSAANLEKMLRKFCNLINDLGKIGIYGYNIKPSNVIMKNEEFHVLREFIDSYPFFYQEDYFLAPEFLECHNAARGAYTVQPDIYSLGVTAFFAFTGKEPWTAYKDAFEYNEARLEQSSYKYILARSKIPERFRLLFKQMLHDDSSVRWKTSNIFEWLDGNSGKTVHESITDNKNIIGFNESNHSNMKSLAYALFNNWEKAIKFARDDKLYKWAGRLEISNDTLMGIKSVIDNKSNPGAIIADGLNANNKISKLLSILDPHGCVRIEGLGFSPKAIPEFLHYLMSNNKRPIAELVLKAMKEEIWKNYSLVESVGYLDPKTELSYKTSALVTSSGAPTKSLERLVYSLNPDAKCLSKPLEKRHVTTLSTLLTELDVVAERDPKKFSVDRHIVAFVASRLNLRDDIKPVVLANFPKFAEHPAIRGLSILSILQLHLPQIKIPNICNALVADLKELFKDHLHNVDFKNEIISSLEDAAKEGDLSKVILSLSNQQKFVNDYNGYYEACKQAKILEDKIKILGSKDATFSGALLLGQKMTVLTSYILCFIVTITVIM
jgi:hypothetical protein